MTGEAQHAYAINDSNADPKQQDKEAVFESLKERDSSELYGSLSENAETTLDNSPDSGSQFCIKDKESHTLREAVIRPQQAGKIDFKSLQNRSKFPSDRAWTSGKGSPQSPTGKSRAKEKNKRSGKGDRNPHQLYRLSISNCRSNPTIGIAYPQQKVTPPKKLESNRGPISGSYRFHVPSIPEREAELQQEDLTFNRSFQEASSSLTSTNYTSQAAAAVHQHHALKPQQQASLPRENSTANGQLHYPEFQANGNNCWHSSEKSFAGVNYGVPSQKPSSFSESNKSSAQGFGPMPFQYPFTPLHDAATDPFNNDHSSHPQDYIDVTLTNNQLTHGAFVFHSSGDGQEEPLSNGHYDALQPDGRNYTLSSQQTQFLHPGTQHQSSLPCYKGRSEHSTDLNGAMSSSGAIMSSGAIEQTQSTFQENQSVFSPNEFSLRNSNVSIPVNKRNSTSKDNVASQRALAQSNSHRRSITQNSLPQVHFQAKVYGTSSTNNKSTVPVPFDKNAPSTVQNHSRVAQAWEGGTTGFPLIDQNSAPYPSSVENQFSFQCQSNTEQRHVPKNGRLPWQQIHLTSAMPNQNRIELSRQLSNQKLHFPLTNSEWQESNKTQKNIPLSNVSGFHNKRHLASESFPNSRNDGARHNCSTANNFSFENGVDSNPPECDSRSKNIFFGMSQQIPPASSRNTSRQQLQIPAVGLISASPYESPLPSPVLNPPSSGTSSSLSPVSSSPVNASSDDSQMPIAVPPPPFYHQQFHPKEGKRFLSSEQLNSSVPYYHHPESLRTQNFAAEGTKDDHVLNCLQDNQFHKQSADSSKECMTSFENEQPPPPPYSSHQLLANSLNSANLDQLDVLLTCKQCDQNFSNLASFLEHRQYCGLHSVCQTELKGASRMTDSRKHNLDSIKISQATSVLPSSRGSSQLQSSLFVLNKNGDFPLDGDVKGEGKDDPPKINIFTGLTASSLSLTASDLEIDDAKLDSLITEALNGLAYQSDNGEIDSSFIDVFADEEPSTAKVFGSGQTYKMKDGFSLENKIKHKGFDERQTFHTKNIYHYEKDEQSAETKNKNKNSEKKHGDKVTSHGAGSKEQKTEEATVKQKTLKKLGDHSLPEKMSDKNTKLKVGRKSSCDLTVQEKMNKSETISGSKKNAVLKEDAVRTSTALAPVVNENTKLRRCGTKDAKKRKSGSGTWSKELIHKIVQQKNKLHKLHVKGNKNFQFSLVTEKLVPSPQSHKFGEYDYISDSDDEDVVPHKFSSGRRLMTGLNGRSKYSFGKRNHGQDDRSKEKEISWRYGCKDRHLQVKSKDAVTQKKESYGGRIRRRSSRSSISTPTSISSESTNSPKSTDRTDSDNDKDTIVKRRSTAKSNHHTLYDYDTLNRVNKEITQGSEITQSDFSKSTKRYGSAKFLLTSNKLRQSRPRFLSTSYGHEESIPQDSKDKYNKDNSKKGQVDLYYKENARNDVGISNDHTNVKNVQVDTEVFADSVRQNQSARKRFSSCEENTVNCPNKGLINDMLHASDTNADINITLSNRSKTIKEHCLCNSQQDLGTNAGCYKDSAEIMLTGKEPDHVSFGDAGQSFCDTKHLTNHYSSDMFPKPILIGSSHLEDMYLCQDDINPNLFQQDHMKQCISTYPAQHEQNRVRSPLTFDSSSMFGEFPVSGFDSQFYPNMSTSKDDFLAFTCNANQSDKSTMFEQPYPSYLQQKDWNLMEEVNPILSEGITNFPSLTGEKSLNKKPTDESTLPSNQVPLPISEKHSDYNVPFTNSMSEDELEIKRLVTELECQLQTSKLNNSEHIAQQSSKHLSTDLSDPSAQFSPLHLEQGTENGKGLFLTNEIDSLANTGLLPSIICVHQTSVNDKSTGPSLNEDYEHHDGSWTCSFPFSSLDTQAGMLTPVHADSNSLDKLYSKEEPAQCHAKSEVENVEKTESIVNTKNNNPASEVHISDQPEDKIETQKYKESLVKSLAVISDSLFSNNTLEHGPEQELPSEPFKGNQPEVCVLEEQEQKKASNVPLKLELFECGISKDQPEFEMQDVTLFALREKSSSGEAVNSDRELSTEASEHTKEPSTALLTERDNDLNLTSSEKSVDPKACQPQKVQENTSKEATSSPKKCLAQEADKDKENLSISQDATVNPLQQLQLFVARTVKHNEEQMMMPCFPVLLPTANQTASASLQHDLKEESIKTAYNSETITITTGSNTNSKSQEKNDSEGALEENTVFMPNTYKKNESQNLEETNKQMESYSDKVIMASELLDSLNNKLQSNVTEPQHLGDKHSESSDLINTDDVSQEHSNLLSLNTATVSPLHCQVNKLNQIVHDVESNTENTSTLIFKVHDVSQNLSTDSFSEISEDNLPKQTLNSDISECSPASHNLREDLHMSCADQNSDQMRHKSDSAVLSDYQSPLESTEEYAEDNLSASIQLHEDKQYFATSKTSTQNTEEESTDMLTESTTTESTYSNDSSLAKLPLQENVIEEAHLSDDHEAHSGNTKPVDDENFHCTFEAPLTYLLPPSPPFGSSPESSFQEQKTDSELKYEIQSNADFAYMLIQDSTRKDNSQDEKVASSLKDYINIVAPSEKFGCNQSFHGKDILSDHEHGEKGVPALLSSHDSLETDSNNCKRASLSKSEGEKNLQADLCTCSTNMQNFEQNETMEGTAKCTCSKLLCSHYKEASSSTTAQILDFQSLPQNFLDTCKSPINSIEYMNLTNDPVKNTKELDFSISFGSNTEQHEKQQLKYKENNLPESVVHKKLNPKDEIFPSSECTNGSHSNVSVKGDDTIKEDKNVQETILFQTKNVNSNVNQDETKETKNGLLCEMGVDGNKAVSKNAPDTSSSSDLQKNTTQADTICDICSASFRSKPGLTRHKAIKHRMKNDGNPPHNKTSKSKSSLTLQENAPIVWKDGSETVVINDIKESTVNLSTLKTFLNDVCIDTEQHPNTQTKETSNNLIIMHDATSSFEVSHGHQSKDMSSEETRSNNQTLLELDQPFHSEDPKENGQPKKSEKEKNNKSKKKKFEDSNSVTSQSKSEKKTTTKQRKRQMKANRRKAKGDNSETKQNSAEEVSDDILNIIKTDLLKAITYPLQSANLFSEKDKFCCVPDSHMEKQVNSSEEDNHGALTSNMPMHMHMTDESRIKKQQEKDGANDDEEHVDKGMCDVSKENLSEIKNTQDEHNMKDRLVEESGQSNPHSPFFAPAVESKMAKNEADILGKTFDESSSLVASQEDRKDMLMQQYKLPSKNITDSPSELPSLFDDDSTFSQLFPRDNQITRKKCTRVYGKRTKKQKAIVNSGNPGSAEALLVVNKLNADIHNDNSFCGRRPNVCVYDTISLDDALMLDMCHSSKKNDNNIVSQTYEDTVPQSKHEELHNSPSLSDDSGKVMSFLFQEKEKANHSDAFITSVAWDHPKEAMINASTEETSCKSPTDLKNEGSVSPSNPMSSNFIQTYDRGPGDHISSSEFHTVDIGILTTKFEIPTIPFFCSEEDKPALSDVTAPRISEKSRQNNKHNRTKSEEGKMIKNRGDINMKSKDKQYKCKVCFQWFLTLGELDFHKLSHNPSPPPTCYMCVQRKFGSREQLRDHLKEKHAKNKAGIWTCGMCLKEISDVWMYNEHLREHATQFARKGQVQKSVIGMPGCFSEDSVVKNFLSTIMSKRQSKLSKNTEAGSKSPTSKENKILKDIQEQDPKTKEVSDSGVKNKHNVSSLIKLSTNASADHMQEAEVVQKNFPIHPDCKDPSRDCHHCGKQFPKPFKLQRHLVVHSLQKIYLCHKCPIFYQETQDLRNHLKQEHGTMEEPEIKHTTLYACELCADVMHVIKKSFICSTCNYTFSKKEQYDRHMEKHLASGRKTFRFRGVIRPCIAAKETNFELQETYPNVCVPPSKKRKVTHDSLIETSSDSGIASVSSVHFNHNVELHLCDESMPVPPDFFPEVVTETSPSLQEMTVKTEDIVEDFSDLLAEMKQSQFNVVHPPPPCLSPPVSQTLDNTSHLDDITGLPIVEVSKLDYDCKPSVSFVEPYELRLNSDQIECNQTSKEKLLPLHLANTPEQIHDHHKSVENGQEKNTIVFENHSSEQNSIDDDCGHETTQKKTALPEPSTKLFVTQDLKEPSEYSQVINKTTSEQGTLKDAIDVTICPLPSKDNTLSPESRSIAKDSVAQEQSKVNVIGTGPICIMESNLKLKRVSETHPSTLTKEPSEIRCNTGQSIDTSKQTNDVQKLSLATHNKSETALNGKRNISDSGKTSEREPTHPSPKGYSKKRKDPKLPVSYKPKSTSRENIEADRKKKKSRVQSPSRSDSIGNVKKIDLNCDFSASSIIKDEALPSKLYSKTKTGGLANQVKKNVFDSNTQKRADPHHSNGEYKRKKDIFGKTFNQLMSKGPGSSMNSSFNKHKTIPGMKPIESYNYRTAESQNNLLSQLFGQKLTSFKIPLRKDTSE
ncbi:uncharacterized protein LOC102363539 [Latimeria chalumnae]|uniref:uncharacterized protein LOC102363539 n=1 Tax=Latimeria chalumnae TaxID=7897 RepID=UPI0006D9246A|nr:PREDICTED: zinc finger protein 469 [Latimeria chalumnae]|eukprot:XP_014340054.1 PREDICTED: zinc finger protein 469 [Latimeria chalumnae]